MRKLMIAAAIAAIGAGVYADNCAPTPGTLVYDLSMTVKTTKGVKASGAVGNVCTPGGSDGVTPSCTVLRTKDTTKFAGYIYDCVEACDTVANGTVVAWDSKRKVQLTGAAFTTTFINVMGTSKKEAEWAWTFAGTADYSANGFGTQAYELTGAGYGKFNGSYYTSFSGNFAGTTSASYDLSSKVCCDPSQIWKCDALADLVDSDTVAFGSWSVKYNAKASKKFNSNGYLKVPNYVTLP